MPISVEAALGIHDQALAVRSQRAGVLASNIVNADTPGYKARDIDFRQALSTATGDNQRLRTTHSRHITPGGLSGTNELMYRTPLQPSIDGNTVDIQIEQAEYARNALAFQASFTFLNSKINGLKRAIRGE